MEEEKKEGSPEPSIMPTTAAKRDSAVQELDHIFDQSTSTSVFDHHDASSLRQRWRSQQHRLDEEDGAGSYDSERKNDGGKNPNEGGDIEHDNEKKDPKPVEEEEDADSVEEGLPTSIFSLLFLADVKSSAHFYSVVVYLVQIIVVIAALLDSFDTDSSSNPAQIPPGVPAAVTIAQGVMIPIAVASQNDFITAIVRLNDRQWETETIGPNNSIHLGHLSMDPRQLKLGKIKAPGEMFVRWLISCLTQLFVGFGILCVSFLFMMQSESVFQVLVNIVALFAISNISGNAYNMAAKGFLGYRVWKETAKVSRHKIKRKYRKGSDYRWEVVLYLLCILAMYIGYGVVVHRQRTGFYLCQQVQVQFDDEFQPNLAFLSGIYIRTDRKIAGRFLYTDEVTRSSFLIGYCREKNSWGLAAYDTDDPCADNILSQQTITFDVTTTGQIPWRVHSQRDSSFVDTSSFYMQCADCSSSSCQPHRGTCINNRCVCKDGRYGVNCEFRAPCENLTLNSNRDRFPPIISLVNEDYVVLDSDYRLLKNATDGYLALSYHRPIYYSNGFQYLLTFAGRRWVIVSPTLLAESGGEGSGIINSKGFAEGQSEVELEDEWKRRIMAEFNNAHMFRHLTNPLLQQFTVSESVDIGSSLDQGSPIGLNWLAMRAVRSVSRPVMVLDNYESFDASFICPFCEDDVNDCHNLGTCNNGTCECRSSVLGFPLQSGALCERPVTCIDVQRDHADILPSGCVGDSQCQADTGSCNCLDEFPDAGRFCQFLPCWTDTIHAKFPGGCDNAGVCSNVTGSCVCQADMFEGKYCQTPTPGCHEPAAQRLHPPNGCDNDGVCVNSTGFCECNSDEFTGRYCQRFRPPCTSGVMQDLYPPNGCANGGTCTDAGSCTCPSEIFTGRYCEATNLPCSDSLIKEAYPEEGCTNGGLCDETTGNCLCDPIQENLGRYCQEEFFLNVTRAPNDTVTASTLKLGFDY
jgi:hypothetical protein